MILRHAVLEDIHLVGGALFHPVLARWGSGCESGSDPRFLEVEVDVCLREHPSRELCGPSRKVAMSMELLREVVHALGPQMQRRRDLAPHAEGARHLEHGDEKGVVALDQDLRLEEAGDPELVLPRIWTGSVLHADLVPDAEGGQRSAEERELEELRWQLRVQRLASPFESGRFLISEYAAAREPRCVPGIGLGSQGGLLQRLILSSLLKPWVRSKQQKPAAENTQH